MDINPIYNNENLGGSSRDGISPLSRKDTINKSIQTILRILNLSDIDPQNVRTQRVLNPRKPSETNLLKVRSFKESNPGAQLNPQEEDYLELDRIQYPTECPLAAAIRHRPLKDRLARSAEHANLTNGKLAIGFAKCASCLLSSNIIRQTPFTEEYNFIFTSDSDCPNIKAIPEMVISQNDQGPTRTEIPVNFMILN